jgi:ATP-dependent helicase HrpB
MRELKRTYPVDDVLRELMERLQTEHNVVLSAPPGAGKTTRVPLALLNSEWLSGKKIIVLEPRRLAARRAAEYMAKQLGERVGETVGYRIRGDTAVGNKTRIEVVTEGILTKIVQHDPELPETSLVIFDEFHERSIHADLGLAFALDVQERVRNDLRILVMSATLDRVAVARLLGDAPVIQSPDSSYPVETHHAKFSSDKPPEVRITDVILRALGESDGDVLVFLPGQREIRRVEDLLWKKRLPEETIVHSLYGDAPFRQQIAALDPAPPGKRKVILSTSIAETSLTIDGVRVVVDSGLARTARFDVRSGMSELITVPVSKAIADQRRGRAGRQQPGVCYRLWTETEHAQLPEYPQPEIKVADLAPLALDLAQWGSPEGVGLRFLDPPPVANLSQAHALLKSLGAFDHSDRLTPHGRAMAELPIHPRLAHMILRGKELGHGAAACDIAAMLEERYFRSGRNSADIDLASRFHSLHQRQGNNEESLGRVLAQAGRLKRLIGIRDSEQRDEERAIGLLLALAYPERIARRRKHETYRYQMASGTIAALPKGSLLGREEFLAIAEAENVGDEARVFLAAALQKADVQRVFAQEIVNSEEIGWSPEDEAVSARRISRLGALIIAEQPFEPPEEKMKSAVLDGVRRMGLECLPWDKESRSLQQRSEWIRRQANSADWPDLSGVTLAATIEEWLGPFLSGIRRRNQLTSLPMFDILRSRFSSRQWQELERLAPAHLRLPSGSHIAIDYSSGDQPVLAVKLQELFGQIETPRIFGGKVGIVLHLLSPASRPLAVTQDLHSFWKNVYPEIRKQMSRRYPKHFWPDDPFTAKPTNKTVRRKK